MTLAVQQDVTGLDVSVDLAVLVEVLQPLERLVQDDSHELLLEPLSQPLLLEQVHHVQTRALVHELRDQPQLVLMHEAAVALEDVRVVGHLHGLHLSLR